MGGADDSVRYQSNERFRGSAVFHVIVLESVSTLGFVRSVSLFACVDGFRDVFVPSVGQILDLSTNFFACGCDLLQSAPLSFAGTVDWTFLSRKAIFVCSMHR